MCFLSENTELIKIRAFKKAQSKFQLFTKKLQKNIKNVGNTPIQSLNSNAIGFFFFLNNKCLKTSHSYEAVGEKTALDQPTSCMKTD